MSNTTQSNPGDPPSRNPLIGQIKAARRVSVPLVAITTPDPGETIQTICDAIKGSGKIVWDIVEGLRPRDEQAKEIIRKLVGDQDPTVGNPIELLRLARKLPDESVLFMHMANRWLAEPTVVQAAWNLRDAFKLNRRMLVMLGPAVDLPAELAGDVIVLDEPLPDQEELGRIIREQHEAVGLELAAATETQAIEAVQGLAAFQSEQVVAMSLTRAGLDVPALWERKRRQIELTPGLKVHRESVRFDQIGGVAFIKDFLRHIMAGKGRPNAIVFIDEIEKHLAGASGSMGDSSGVSQDQLGSLLTYMQDQQAAGCIFVGPPGCLCGETQMLYRRGNRHSGRRITLQKLFEKFNGIPCQGGRGEVTPWHKPCDTYLHSYDHQTGQVFYNRVLNIRDSGEKECLCLILSSGERLRLTPDHPVLTPDGFVEAGQLQPSDEVVVRGDMLPRKSPQRAPRKERVIVRGLKFYSSGANADVTDPKTGVRYSYKRQYRSRLVIEAELNSLSYESYLKKLRTDPQAAHLKTLEEEKDVHHRNEDSMDDRRENLQVIPHDEHPLEHDVISRFGTEYTRIETIVDISDGGTCRTFDIQMQSPANNFSTAAGLFVHNSAKSMVAKAAGNEGGIPTIQLDLGGLKGSLVGQSEQNLRSAMKVITSVSNGRSLWIATCNSIGELPPELRRRFTLGTYFFDLPDESEREIIWKMYCLKYFGPNHPGFYPSSDGWTGAEIHQCCDIAWRLGGGILENAAKYIVPVSRSASEQLERLRKMAEGRFLSASHGGIYQRPNEEAGEVLSVSRPRSRRLATVED